MATAMDFHERWRVAVIRFQDEIRELSEAEMQATPRGERLMGIAKALCDAENGKDRGDAIVLGGRHHPMCRDARDTVALMAPIRPLWWAYLGEAMAALCFLESEAKSEVPSERVVDFMAAVRDTAKR